MNRPLSKEDIKLKKRYGATVKIHLWGVKIGRFNLTWFDLWDKRLCLVVDNGEKEWVLL